MSLSGKSIEELQAAAREMMDAMARGELTQRDVTNFIIEAGPEVERVCREYGESSDRCANMKLAIQELVNVLPTLPVGVSPTYGRGTLAVVGLGGLIVGGLLVYLLQK